MRIPVNDGEALKMIVAHAAQRLKEVPEAEERMNLELTIIRTACRSSNAQSMAPEDFAKVISTITCWTTSAIIELAKALNAQKEKGKS